jgi:hypothetical protein
MPTVNTGNREQVMPDLGITFETFQKKYNDVAKTRYLLNNGNVKKQGQHYLCHFSYATMKVEIDTKTKNISNIEIYGEYTKKISSAEKQALLTEQKKVFEIATEVFVEQLRGQVKSQENKDYIFLHDLEDWNGYSYTEDNG